MKKFAAMLVCVAALSTAGFAQSATTERLQRQYPGSLNLFFYHNTLRMINQQESETFDELIKDIQKMRFLMIRKSDLKPEAYSSLIKDYRAERFEPIMNARHDGRNFDVYLKETGKEKGMLVLVNDTDNLMVLDILGSIAPDKVGTFLSTLDKSTDIGQKISNFIK